MAGAMRKMAVYLGLVEDELDADEYDDYDDHHTTRSSRGGSSSGDVRTVERVEPRTVRTVREEPPAPVRPVRPERVAPPASARASRVEEPRHTPAPAPLDGPYRITTLHPRSYNDARRIGEEFRDGVPVIMNLTEMDDVDAKRIVDFAAGLVFGLRGSIERVTNKVFLLSPDNVDVAAEARAQLAQDGFFNQS